VCKSDFGFIVFNSLILLTTYLYYPIQSVPGGKCICTCVLFRTVSEIEIFHCTVHYTGTPRSTQTSNTPCGRTIAQAVSSWLPTAAPGFELGSGQMGFVVDKVALGQVFSEYFGFPCQSSFHQFSIITITRGRYNRPFSGRCAE
jgi:hypothetical protein